MDYQEIPVVFNDSNRGNLKDKFSLSNPINSGDTLKPKGRVQIFEQKLDSSDKRIFLVRDTSNLIVYRGRNWLLQRAFNTDQPCVTGTRSGWSSRFISWLGVGTGGSVSGDPLTPSSPALSDYALSSPILIGGANSDYVSVGTGASTRHYHKFDTGYPKFLPDSEIPAQGAYESIDSSFMSLDPDSSSSTQYKTDSFLISKIQVTIYDDECNGGTGDDDYQDINEACLFASPSSSTSYSFSAGQHVPFARVCFSTIRKTNKRRLIFVWYVYF